MPEINSVSRAEVPSVQGAPALSGAILGGAAGQNVTPQAPSYLQGQELGLKNQGQQIANDTNQLGLHMAKLSATSNLLGAVINAPDNMKEQAYQQALQLAPKYGLSTEGLPKNYDANFVTNMALQSDKALKIMQASAQYQMNLRKVGNEGVSAQAAAARGEAALASSGNPQAAQGLQANAAALGSPPLSGGALAGLASNNPILNPAQAGQQPSAPSQQTGIPSTTVSGGQGSAVNQGAAISGLQGPAELEAQKMTAKDWNTAMSSAAKMAQGIPGQRMYLESAKEANRNASLVGPGIGILGQHVGKGYQLDKDAQNLNMYAMQNMTGTGFRMMNSTMSTITKSNMSSQAPVEVNEAIAKQKGAMLDWAQFVNEGLQKMNNQGIRSVGTADAILNRVWQNIDAINPKTGEPNLKAINEDAPKELNRLLKNPNSPDARPYQYQDKNGNIISPTDYAEVKFGHKLTDAEMIKTYGLKQVPLDNNQGNKQQSGVISQGNNTFSLSQATNNQIPSVPVPNGIHPAVPLVMGAIAMQESGNKGYTAVGPQTPHGTPIGKYQVLTSNIPQWTQEALGQKLTTQQFLRDPQAQDQVAAYKMNEYFNSAKGSIDQKAADVARAWKAGPGGSINSYDRTVHEKTSDYVNKITKNLNTLIQRHGSAIQQAGGIHADDSIQPTRPAMQIPTAPQGRPQMIPNVQQSNVQPPNSYTT